MLCEYGCGNEVKFFLKRSKKWCCSKSYNSCPISREKNRKSHVGEKNHRYGQVCSDETKEKIRKANKGNIPWNKDRIGVYSEETIESIRNAMFGKTPWNKGITHSDETKEKISNSLKGNIPWNKGIPRTQETKLKISLKNMGRKRSKVSKENQKKRISGRNNPKWKGGYSSQNIPLYKTFAKQLTIEEDPKRDIIDANILTVLCANVNCRKRFIPKLSEVSERIRSLKGTQNGECRIYCAEKCKISCSIFNKSKYPKGYLKEKLYTQNEYKQFRTFVLERDNYNCQYCEEKAIIVHHERPQKLEPFFSLDPDYAWSCCEKCHYEKGHKDECSTGNLSKINC